jgi:mono/diheme cytochrome c family protein
MSARRVSRPGRPGGRVFVYIAALAAGPACPGFGDRLAPDAARAGDPDGFSADAAADARTEDVPVADLRRLDAEPADAAPSVPVWAPEMADFFVRHCGLCHGQTPVGGAPYPLVTYAQVVPHLAAVLRRTVELQDMPPGGGLVTDAERAALLAWVEAGAPEGPEDAAPPGAAAER